MRQPLCPFLDALLVYDQPDRRMYLTPRHLDAWGVRPLTAFATAARNLDPAHGLHRDANGLWVLETDDGYTASRLALPGWLAAFRGRVDGEPIAIAPHGRQLWVGGSDNADQVVRLVDSAVRGWRTESEPISPVPYTVNARGGLTPFSPGPDLHPIASAMVRAAERAFAESEYRRQAEQLDDTFDELPLAPCEVGLGRADARGIRRAFSFARWRRGVPCLLPEVDTIIFTDETHGALLAVPWAAVAEPPLTLLHPTLAPRRWTTLQAWPDRSTWETLRSVALDPEDLG